MGSKIIISCVIAALVYKGQSLQKEIVQLRKNLSQSSADQLLDWEIRMMEIRKLLCGDTSEELAGCVVCPDGWLQHRENCYNISSSKVFRTWNESREVCEEMGADLLVIEDPEQQEFIKNSSREQTHWFWIGLYRDGDGWRWVDGRLYNTGLFQQSQEFKGNCILKVAANYYMENCQSKYSWICQKRALKI
ncbi:killer cell lectin-like receptor subfamily B member 1B allele B [Aquarana catesbeiana]|uniref:killer cell lectin-like receptor subfamily B member 1B allele B n=1 Tax=Aquarana catesbeiana TaxID=8400 RepID=UPI003CC9A63A